MMDEADPTPLALHLVERIGREGPISVRDYMDACLNHPEHGYYRTRGAIGAKEDFVTAPEISQVFGELIGLWAGVVWQQMGAPARVRLVELGPGRGTLMRDALRAARKVPGFCDALEVSLVEQNATLQAVQRETLRDSKVSVQWYGNLSVIADDANGKATVVIANEFLDVIPVDQLQFTDDGWVQRAVTVVNTSQLAFTDRSGRSVPPARTGNFSIGAIVEQRDLAPLTAELRRLAEAGPLAGLFIDYGYEGAAAGSTLQAIRNQKYHDVFAQPGEADLTAHVDFAAAASDFRAAGLAIDGPCDQATFLSTLGIAQRTSRLMAANPVAAGTLEAATARLISPTGMGTLFRAIGVRSSSLPPLPGL
jgi:NADH dehydrogenase [ubiquinone] 1 alpha subcomplex assembly factor 7